jgi:hypothetical protein
MCHSTVLTLTFALVIAALLPASAQQPSQISQPKPPGAQVEPTTMGTVVVTGLLPGLENRGQSAVSPCVSLTSFGLPVRAAGPARRPS